MKPKYATKVISELSQVPEGYISMTELRQGLTSTEAKKLSDCHMEGHVRAVKLMRTINDTTGPVFIHMKDYQDWTTSRLDQKQKTTSKATSNEGIERIADAVERTNQLLSELLTLWRTPEAKL